MLAGGGTNLLQVELGDIFGRRLCGTIFARMVGIAFMALAASLSKKRSVILNATITVHITKSSQFLIGYSSFLSLFQIIPFLSWWRQS